MIDLSELMCDPDFCEWFTIRHRKGRWVNGSFVAEPIEESVSGIAEPTNGDDLAQLPEADRIGGTMTFYVKECVTLGNDTQLSDEIISGNQVYKVVQIQDWSRHGFYKIIANLSGRVADGTS